MSRGVAPWICNQCGKHRTNDVNHWHIILVRKKTGALAIYKWEEKYANRRGAVHTCGANCRNILVERFFLTGSFDKTQNDAPGILDRNRVCESQNTEALEVKK